MCPSPGDHGRAVGGNGRPAQRTLLRDAAESHSPGNLERWALHALRRVLERRAARSLLRPGDGIDTVITADAYGAGEADTLLSRALQGVPSESYSLVGAVGHDFYE